MKRYNICFMSLLLIAGCSVDFNESCPESNAGDRNEFISTKVTNTSSDAVDGMLLVKSVDGKLELGGIDIPSLDITAIEQAFPVSAKNADKLAKAGLADWYVIRFSKGTDLTYAAKAMSESEKIGKIQFNKKMRLDDGGTISSNTAQATGVPSLGTAEFNDPMLADQWHYINRGAASLAPTAREGADINVKDAWKLTAGDPSVIVAVVDQGVKYTHPDLAANMWVNKKEIPGNGIDDDGNGFIDDVYGYNFVKDGAITWAEEGASGHGTHVAGTVAAVNNNGIGVCGVAGGTGNGDGVRIMSCQVFDGESGGDALSTSRAFVYAADNGAAIIQCSFGASPGQYDKGYGEFDMMYEMLSPLEAYALRYFLEYGGGDVLDGGLAIFSAGNDSKPSSGYPAAYSELISVTSIGPDYLPASYTNYGPGCNIAAPGGEMVLNAAGLTGVLSTLPSELTEDGSGYGYKQGTSMACPHVSGVAALGLSYAKKLDIKYTREEFTDLLLTSVNDLEGQLDREKDGMKLYEYHGKMGTGLVDAWKLLMRIEGTPSVLVPVGKESSVELSSCLGGSAVSLGMYAIDVTIDDDAMEALGVSKKPVIENGRLKIKCTRSGSAKIKVQAIVDHKECFDFNTGKPYDGDEKVVTKDISLIARGVASSNGGWL